METNVNWTWMVGPGSIDGMDLRSEPPAGLFVPLITPFTGDGELDPASLEALAHRVLDDGATGIVALGTTAEAPTLTDAERTVVLDICAAVCRDRAVPLIAGTTCDASCCWSQDCTACVNTL